MTAVKATNMLLEEERKGEKSQQSDFISDGYRVAAAAVGNRAEKSTCKKCGRKHGPVC